MKKTLNGSQMTELRKLGYMKDDSLAGLIEFQIEYFRLSINDFSAESHPIISFQWTPWEELIDLEYERVKELLEKKHEK